MRWNRVVLVTLMFVVVLGTARTALAVALLGSDFDVLYDIDRSTGLASNPRDTGRTIVGIAFGDGILFGGTGSWLYSIDMGSGETELIGELDGLNAVRGIRDLAWDPATSLLYALVHLGGTTADYLYTIDAENLEASLVGSLDGSFQALAFDAQGRLFAADPYTDALATIDKSSAATTYSVHVAPELGQVAAMTFDDAGSLFVATDVGHDPAVLHLLDPQSGLLTPLGSTGLPTELYSLAYVPEPGTLILLGAGCILLSRRRYRCGPSGTKPSKNPGICLAPAVVRRTASCEGCPHSTDPADVRPTLLPAGFPQCFQPGFADCY